MEIAIIGGGPAGLRAAEVAAGQGAAVTLFDAMPSVGRKFLVAGRGGLNLSKAEPADAFAGRYSGPAQPAGFWPKLIAELDFEALRAWAAALGVETFVASTGRIYPRELKAAPLLRRWVERLRKLGVRFAMRHRWSGFAGKRGLRFSTPGGEQIITPDAAVFALGGGSWPQTGSDGAWTAHFAAAGIAISPLQPANCGWECAWSPALLAAAEGQPLKGIAVSAGDATVPGELLITRYGLEGGAIYQLGAILRAMPEPRIQIDFKPAVSAEKLRGKMGPITRNFLAEARTRWKLSAAAAALLAERAPFASLDDLIAGTKRHEVRLTGPRPIAEAISSAGGVAWAEVDENLMLRKRPGIFIAGEMLDWEAPTGGYLIHGCFATGGLAGRGAGSFACSA
jgi:uncharacterized flavoprotein (TIGR03862 family)